jgi:hypothetical protein
MPRHWLKRLTFHVTRSHVVWGWNLPHMPCLSLFCELAKKSQQYIFTPYWIHVAHKTLPYHLFGEVQGAELMLGEGEHLFGEGGGAWWGRRWCCLLVMLLGEGEHLFGEGGSDAAWGGRRWCCLGREEVMLLVSDAVSNASHQAPSSITSSLTEQHHLLTHQAASPPPSPSRYHLLPHQAPSSITSSLGEGDDAAW